MKINKKTLSFSDIYNDLDEISKKLYLDSPDIWIDFSDKVSEKKLDEMVLFYAAKFNYLSILKYAIDNNVIDLNIPSKNKSYSSIKEHLLAVSKDYKSHDVYNYLDGDYKLSEENIEINENKSSEVKEEKNHKDYFPIFLCPHCNTNILKSGYKVYEEISFAFSQDKSKSQELNRERDNKVFCNSCNSNINNITTELLEDICSIHNCKKCGKDLTKIGITEKIKMKFNEDDGKFIGDEKTYNCPSCDKELNESQKKYFNL
ncbi:hypothetical protein [Terrisporobacter glycolicus]|uniref:hypothetical protein n=1 Tax=Terrisporobacter glycolicus TaxID=36841 RepID=UPI000AF7BE63